MADRSLTLPYHWTQRPYQKNLWNYLQHGGKRAVMCAHRRWGKDEVCLHHTACAAHERIGNYAHMLPEYAQARKAIWSAVNPHTGKKRIDEAFPEALREGTNDQEMVIRFKNGSTWQVVGSDNYNSLMGTSFAGIVMSEYALANPSAWAYFSPILRENDGWALFISTPRGHNHFESILKAAKAEPSWYWEISTVDETQCFSQDDLQEELRIMQETHGPDYGKAIWLQEYFCSFDAAIPGSIWGDCIDRLKLQGRIVDFSHNTLIPVDTGWDLGRTDDTAIWFRQMNGQQIDVIDYHSSNGKDIDWYVDFLREQAAKLQITYGTHWLPHDARPRTLAAGGKSILQQFLDASKKYPDLGRFAIAPRLDRQEGIQAGRKTFVFCRFHATRCAKGLELLRAYHRAWDDEKKIFLDIPTHDQSSHPADAWRTLAVTWKRIKESVADAPLVDKLMAASVQHQTFGALKQQHFDRKRRHREWAT